MTLALVSLPEHEADVVMDQGQLALGPAACADGRRYYQGVQPRHSEYDRRMFAAVGLVRHPAVVQRARRSLEEMVLC